MIPGNKLIKAVLIIYFFAWGAFSEVLMPSTWHNFIPGYYYNDVKAQESHSPILIIYDASGSMWGQMEGSTKKEIGARVLTKVVNGLPEEQPVGLMVYGHRREKDCGDIEMLVELNNVSKERINESVQSITPLGRTPLARSAILAIQKIKQAGNEATIILITDGIESCDGDLCKVVSAARQDGLVFKMHIVGFGLKDTETEVLRCAAEAGGGRYFEAADADGLAAALQEVTTQTVDNPLENISVLALKNNEPVDAWVRAYKAGTQEEVDGTRTYRDTGRLFLPPGNYDINVQPLEGTDISNRTIQMEVKSGKTIHRTVSFDGARLDVLSTNNGEGWDSVVKVFKAGTNEVVAGTRTYGRTKSLEIDPGTYDVQFQALVIQGLETVHKIENIEVGAGETKEIAHTFTSGRVLLGVQTTGGELIDATVGFTEVSSGRGVAGGRTYTTESSNPKEFVLSPGSYKVKIVTLGKHKGSTTSIDLTVKARETTSKTLTF